MVHCLLWLQPWPKVLRMIQILSFTKSVASVFLELFVRCYYGILKYNYKNFIRVKGSYWQLFDSLFAVLTLLFQDLYCSPWHAVNQHLGHILTDGSPSLNNQCLEIFRICGVLFVHPLLEDLQQVLNGIKVWGVAWSWTQNFDVLFHKPLSYHFCLIARCSIMLFITMALFITKLFLDG